MQKKVFLRRGGAGKGPGGGPPYVKYLLWAILGISLAVVAVSYLLNPKTREASRRTMAEKPSVRKELPKPPEAAPGEVPPGIQGGLAAKPETPAEPAKPSEPAPSVEPQPAPQQPVQPQEPVQTAKPPEPAPRDIFPKSPQAPALTPKIPPAAPAPAQKTPPVAQAPAQKSEKAQRPEKAEKKEPKEQAKTAKTAPAPEKPETAAAPVAKPETKVAGTAGKGGSFSVQIGCYKEKQSADEVVARLRKRGYDVSLCPSAAGGGYAFTVITKPVSSMSKASTLAEQLKSEPKVSPTVIKSAAACGLETPAVKSAMKKPAVLKQNVKPDSAAPGPAKKAVAPAVEKKAEKSVAAKKPLPGASAKPKPATPAKTSD